MVQNLTEEEEKLVEAHRRIQRPKELNRRLQNLARRMLTHLAQEGHDGSVNGCDICATIHEADEVLDELAEL